MASRLTRILSLLILATGFGCGRPPATLPPSIPPDLVYDVDDPESIKRWESGDYNLFDSKICVRELRYLHGTLGGGGPKSVTKVGLRVAGAQDSGIDASQQSAIDALVSTEAEVHAALRKAVYADYVKNYSTYKQALSLGATMFGGSQEAIAEMLPEVVVGNELDGLVEFSTIYIHPRSGDETFIGVEMEIPWDGEHGLGVRLNGSTVVAIGIDGEALPIARTQQ